MRQRASSATTIDQLLLELPARRSPAGTTDLTLDYLCRALEADRVLLYRLDAQGEPFVAAAHARQGGLTEAQRNEITRTVVRPTLRSGAPLFGPLTVRADSFLALNVGGVMAVPIPRLGGPPGTVSRDRFSGLLYAHFRRSRPALDPARQRLFHAVAHLLALVVAVADLQPARRRPRRPAPPPRPEETPTLEALLAPPSMARLRRKLLHLIDTRTPILLLGEAGVGKTLLARALAAASSRATPFVRVNLGPLEDKNTARSELFGHVRGAFTGAESSRLGKVQQASGGTLFLDEILNLPIAVQPLLLDFLQDGTYEPLGWSDAQPRRADVRIIAATNGNLGAALRDGRFRHDLLYRIAGVVVTVPPLRDRREEIPDLARDFLRRLVPDRPWRMSPALGRWLTSSALPWPGNMRQLQFLVANMAAAALADDPEATLLDMRHLEVAREGMAAYESDLAPRAGDTTLTSPAPADWAAIEEARRRLDRVEADLIAAAMERCAGNLSAAARSLGLPRSRLRSRLRALGLETAGLHSSTTSRVPDE